MSTEAKAPSRAILYALMFGPFFAMFDAGLINVGLPVIAREFGAEMIDAQWVTSVYLLAISALMPIFGTLSDRIGRGRIYNLGFFTISIFTLLCGFAPNLPLLILCRVLQAVGGAMVMANGMAIATESYPASERGRNLGLLASMVAVGSIAGPSIGGVVIGMFGWRVAFYLTFVVSFAAFAVTFFAIPRKRRSDAGLKHFDHAGAVLFALSIFAFIYGVSGLGGQGAHAGAAHAALLVCAVAFPLLLWVERRAPWPVLDIGLFRNRVFSSAIGASVISYATMYSPTILLPFYLQGTLGLSPQAAGLYLLAFPVAMALLSPLSGRLSDRIGSRPLAVAALVLNGLALIAFGLLTPAMPQWTILLPLFAMGVGLGMFQSPNSSAAMGNVPREKLGAGTSLVQLTKNLGMVMGIAFSTLAFSLLMAGHDLADAQAYLASARTVYWVAAALSFLGAWIASLRGQPAAPPR
ncbi:MAG: MFS transporter [Candidatus Dactylopiibacterium carminicum]|nr:MAG: MFS transporter [Candidatus Dactylopiibacterium carminicum]